MIQTYLRSRTDQPTNLSQKRIEVYLDACTIRGTLDTAHPRVSDHLGSTEEVIRLRDAHVVLRDDNALSEVSLAIIIKSEVLYVVDLTPHPAGHAGFQVEKDPVDVTLNIGTVWLKGRAHLPIGGELSPFVAGTLNRFMAITEATVVGYDGTEPRTVLINRDQLRCMLVTPS